jgi:histidine triad (HIT) family protein
MSAPAAGPADCIFCKIIKREKPAAVVFEDDHMIAIKDLHPQAPTHILLIPKEHIPTIEEASPEILGRLTAQAAITAKEQGISARGYRTVINCREHGGQSVGHLHLHLLGGRWLSWPPG